MMTCEQARDRLPLALTGDLAPDEAELLSAHLEECPECRRKRAALEAVRRALDDVPSPEVSVDVPGIYAAAGERRERALRVWRRVAYAGMAVAAGLLFFLLSRIDFEIGNGQFVVRWGPRPAPVIKPPEREITIPPVVAAPANRELEERVEILSKLVRALSDDIDLRDHQRQDEIAAVLARLERLRTQTSERLAENRRDLGALYNVQFGKRD
jgi:anti-sigma factor RsiW